MAKQDDYTRYTIRVPSDLYDKVASDAESKGRSINAEILARLQVSFSAPELEAKSKEINDLISKNEAILAKLEEVLFKMGYRDSEGNPPKFPKSHSTTSE